MLLPLTVLTSMVLIALAVPCLAQATDPRSLREAFKDHFVIGCAVNDRSLSAEDSTVRDRIAHQFNTVTPENAMKWQPFNPTPRQFNHAPADRFVDFGTTHSMYVVGHTLFWHSQTPKWVFEDEQGKPITREKLLDRMRQRVRHVAERYGDKIHAWDVVNEAVLDNGKLRESPWTQIIGDDFVEQAFRIADAELPKSVELLYNDYSMEGPSKRDAVAKMVRELKAKGVRIDGIGTQAHWAINGPSIANIEASIVAFAEAGVKVHVTELDIDVLPRKPEMFNAGADVQLRLQGDPTLNPYVGGLPDAMHQKLAERYAGIFNLFIKHRDKIKRVTFWGESDNSTWLNNWPIKGRTSHPLLFDREGKPKPAYFAVIGLVPSREQR